METLSQQELEYRLGIDYCKTEEEVRQELRRLLPNATSEELETMMQSPKLDFRMVDGQKRYFRSAARNLFRLDPQYVPLRDELGLNPGLWRTSWTKRFMYQMFTLHGESALPPICNHFLWDFRLTVRPDAVPAGEVIRCWLPIPQQIKGVQSVTSKILTSPVEHQQAPAEAAHQTVYMERTAVAGEPTVFSVKCSVRIYSETTDFLKVFPYYDSFTPELEQYLAEKEPHIRFTKKLLDLSRRIVSPEQPPLQKAMAIFKWISDTLPWASAREYSTIENIPEHVIAQGGGDCGQKTLLFITLCRINGIPARWQSGFMLHCRHQNLHDWAEIFLPDHGWVAVDTSFGLLNHLKYDVMRSFYFGNRDGYHMAVNSDISAPLFPPKQFPRSETVDFQRGEVEWSGGNLYFPDWDYSFKGKLLHKR